jgi:hypothetical protein
VAEHVHSRQYRWNIGSETQEVNSIMTGRLPRLGFESSSRGSFTGDNQMGGPVLVRDAIKGGDRVSLSLPSFEPGEDTDHS